jgi:hypothetical protein
MYNAMGGQEVIEISIDIFSAIIGPEYFYTCTVLVAHQGIEIFKSRENFRFLLKEIQPCASTKTINKCHIPLLS